MDNVKLTQLDRRAIRNDFGRAAASYDNVSVLQRRVADELLERVKFIKIRPKVVLDAGCRTGYVCDQLESLYGRALIPAVDVALAMLCVAARKRRWLSRCRFAVSEVDCLPLSNETVDLVVSNLTLQWSDPEAALSEFRRVLKPGGVLMFSTFGQDTLQELRAAWLEVDSYPHVHQFLDMHDLGDELLRAQFEAPVVDVDRITVTYQTVGGLLRDLKRLGAQNAAAERRRGLTGRQRFARFRAAYEARRHPDGTLPATYEVIYGHAWVPQAKQRPPPAPDVAAVPLEQITRRRV